MDHVIDAAQQIRRGSAVDIDIVLDALRRATEYRRGRPLFERIGEPTVVIGPLRGHASDFAHYLLTKILPNESVRNIVFLGNYIDGAHQSVEVLYLVALLILHSGMNVVPLIGKHELLYPIQPENFGSLKNELQLRARHANIVVEQYEDVFRRFFASLSVACLIDDRFFCVAGGPASGFRHLDQITAATRQEALKEFVVNEQMDEDEERIAGSSAFVASSNETDAFRFTFNATCNFISRNKLATLVVGMEYHINRPDYDSFARPNHYKESIYFPGFILGRIHPETGLPAVITVFSAPCFCGVNRNNACLVSVTSSERLEIQELKAYERRQLITPAPYDHALSWAQPMLEKALASIAREMIFGTLTKELNDMEDESYTRSEAIATAKMRRMCQLLKAHDLPLPELPREDSNRATPIS